jgi:hypothetical protein
LAVLEAAEAAPMAVGPPAAEPGQLLGELPEAGETPEPV